MHSPRRIRFFYCVVLLSLLAGCNPPAAAPSPGNDFSTLISTLPPTWTETATSTNTHFFLTAMNTPTPWPTNTKFPTNTKTARPTTIPTPTHGLPPTVTRSPRQTCPPPTHVKADITFVEEIADYGPQILNYIRANGNSDELQAQIERLGKQGNRVVDYRTGETEPYFFNNIANVVFEDVTGDRTKEIIISILQVNFEIAWPGLPEYKLGFFVFGCKDRQYAMLQEWGAYAVYAEGSGITVVRDINADGIREIVVGLDNPTHSAHQDIYFSYLPLEWNGDSFRSLFGQIEDNPPPAWVGQESWNLPIEIRDIDSNGTEELLFPYDALPTCGFGPPRVEKRIFMWDGERYRYMWTDQGMPVYRFQAAFAGDYFSEISLYDKSEVYYRMAISDPGLQPYVFTNYCGGRNDWEPDEPDTIIAYARFRLVELLAYLKRADEAELELNQLAEDFLEPSTGYHYVWLAYTFWQSFQAGGNIDDACAAVRDEAEKQQAGVFDPIYFGYADPGPSLETICPFHSGSG